MLLHAGFSSPKRIVFSGDFVEHSMTQSEAARENVQHGNGNTKVKKSRLAGLHHWLVAGAPGSQNYGDIIAEIGARLRAAGVPVDQFGSYKTMVHPELPGRLDAWSPKSGARQVLLTSENLSSELWIGTPAECCSSTGREVVYTFGSEPEFDKRSDQKRLELRGYTQVVNLPLHSSYTPVCNVASFATKQIGGFSSEALDELRDLQAAISRVTESFILHKSTTEVLSTYVGRDAGARVLAGNIVRGDTEVIPAVLLFTDLVGFTSLSNSSDPADTVKLLNRHFTTLDAAVRAQGGEILKFIGDGALSIFPTQDDRAATRAAAVAAISAVEDARDATQSKPNTQDLKFRAALHLGDVHYGNIGSPNRLDFTVVGPAVNLAARMLEKGSHLGEDTVCSVEFARLVGQTPRPLGSFELKGFETVQELLALDLD